MGPQVRRLRQGTDVVVGTPGRVQDMLDQLRMHAPGRSTDALKALLRQAGGNVDRAKQML